LPKNGKGIFCVCIPGKPYPGILKSDRRGKFFGGWGGASLISQTQKYKINIKNKIIIVVITIIYYTSSIIPIYTCFSAFIPVLFIHIYNKIRFIITIPPYTPFVILLEKRYYSLLNPRKMAGTSF
jgi:hypothetical protein